MARASNQWVILYEPFTTTQQHRRSKGWVGGSPVLKCHITQAHLPLLPESLSATGTPMNCEYLVSYHTSNS